MPKTLSISSRFNAPAERVIDEVKTPRLLRYVTRGMLDFVPIDPPEFPEIWEERRYEASMRWKGFLPVGRQIIGIEFPREDETFVVRDNGSGGLVSRWDHLIFVEPDGDGCRYTDQLTIEAGALTEAVALFAGRFYRHRQGRWKRLIRNGFDYSQ